MTSKNFNELLLSEFPEIKDDFDKYVEWQDGIETGSFLVIEDVFMKYFYAKIEELDFQATNKICSFIERVYLLNDEYASNVIVVGILENLKSSDYSAKISEFLHPITLKEYKEIEL
ncbi:MAG: hypothetical protein IJS58_02685 [Bacilli bacterium]|nr:hypothetical protein [Bacilli bacterium]